MQSPGKESHSKSIEINSSQQAINSVQFTEDGKHVLSSGDDGVLRRWQVADGHEVAEPIQIEDLEIFATALSLDAKWLVFGLRDPTGDTGLARASVWNAQTHKKVFDIKGHTDTVFSVDISPDATRFATGGHDNVVFIWSLTTGQSLIGPLQHDGVVVEVRFSPKGDRLATATAENPDAKSIRIYDSDNGQRLLEIPFKLPKNLSSPFFWSLDGHQISAASNGEVKYFDASSGSVLCEWSIPSKGEPACTALARNQKFFAVSACSSLSFWDTSNHSQIGPIIKHPSTIWSISISPTDDCIAIGEANGKVTLRSFQDILPVSYFTVNVSRSTPQTLVNLRRHGPPLFLSHVLPLMHLSEDIFKAWTQGDLARVEELLEKNLTESAESSDHAYALAYRALARSRLGQWDMATNDAKESVKIQRSVIGHIARAIAHVGNGDLESAIRVFDLVFCHALPSENNLLLLIKAVLLFEYGKHDDAISRVDDLIEIVDDPSSFVTVRAQMLLILAYRSMERKDYNHTVELLKRAQEAVPFRRDPCLVTISLLSGWDFDKLAPAIQLHLWKAQYAAGHTKVAESLTTVVETLGPELLTSDTTADWDLDLVQKLLRASENIGDSAVKSKNPKHAILQYSTALSLHPLNPSGLFVKRSNAQAMLGMWEEALKDADEAIKADSSSPWAYEKRHAALHGLHQYDEAINAFTRMHSLILGSLDPAIRKLGDEYISPTRCETAINDIIREFFETCPLVLIDIKSGRLCDSLERTQAFKSDPQFKELVSSMTNELDEERIKRAVEIYFQYVTLSHVWEGKEPSFQDVSLAGSVWDLASSPLNEKLHNFCEAVRGDGYRWAWSDTCCIDKTISTVLNQSLRMMYRWYEASAATFVVLVDVLSPSVPGKLTESIWMTRAWTSQELLSPKVVRFYTRDWQLYLGDTRPNHKESPEIMHELTSIIGVSRENIISFHPDKLSVREKLRLASTRNATVEEDIAYSLIGIFKSDIRPDYGEGYAAIGHLLEEIVSRSGEVTVLDWIGQSSPYNSCLPATLAVYSRPPGTLATIDDAEMDVRIATLQNSLRRTDATQILDRIRCLPPARFASRRLHLPCIIFAVKRLVIQDFGRGQECRYRARVSGIGDVTFQTLDRLPLTEPRKLIFVHPWIHDMLDPYDGFIWGPAEDEDDEDENDEDDKFTFISDGGAGSPTSPRLHAAPAATMDNYARALRLIVRLQQPFHALLLQQQPSGEFKRIATSREIIIPGIDRRVNFARDVRTEVVEIL